MTDTTITKPPTDCDVLVYGGNPCGIAAAVAAARLGARVVLIEASPKVGGHLANGVNTAETEHMAVWSLGGIADEFFRAVGRHYGRDHPLFFWENKVGRQVFDDMLGAEANLGVYPGWHILAAEANAGRIASVLLADTAEQTTCSVRASCYVDASYEGDVMALAGVSYTFGRESIAQYGESLAGIRLDPEVWHTPPLDDRGEPLPGITGEISQATPGEAHPGVICYNYRPAVTRVPGRRIPFAEPEGYDPGRYELLRRWFADPANGLDHGFRIGQILGLYPRPNRKMEANNQQAAIISLGLFGGQFDYPEGNWAVRQRIAQEHRRWAQGLLWYLASSEDVPARVRAQANELGYDADEFTDTGHFPWLMYVREARRMQGRTIVTQRDVAGTLDERSKADAVAIASHWIDSHHIQRLRVGDRGFCNEGRIWQEGLPYQVPYSALTPRAEQASNLLVPGAASFSHVAFCSYRLESTWMTTGHAAGVAAALSCERGLAVQSLDAEHLQRRLLEQGQVLRFDQTHEFPEAWIERQADPDDRAFAYHWEHD